MVARLFYCDNCGPKMLGHSTSTSRKKGGQRYYLCSRYMRKGKDFCEYIS
ncbi:recombinase zinc beta ribbon domain-containing protein [Paenibacillus sp. TAF43_2]